ncbi:MAG: TetR/AcrR family transcriptional regulator, partial [Mucilaginibacter polytrichastri]|nr:TetR/AcrR family transcriptional regulator [Mucilaginibacter polytrichastri]
TLYRYFKDRETLISACYADMLQTWHDAMLTAFNNQSDPIRQLEEMLYAAIDSGTKYLFLNRLESKNMNVDAPDREKLVAYEQAKNKWFSIVPELQMKGIVDSQLSAAWIRILFINTVRTSVEALTAGDVAKNDLKRLAWRCFSRSIGINS